MFSSVFVVLALSASVLANVFITAPVGSTNMAAGQPFTVTWKDDGNTPSLQAFGAASVAIYAGNSQQQTQLQVISASVDVSTAQSVTFTPQANIGPNTNQYFVRISSLALKDAAQPMYPALAFSAKFTMSGMTGNFTAAVQAQIDGQSTAPIGGTAAPTAASSTSAPAVATSSVVVTSKASSASAAAGAAKTSASASSSSANGANKLAGAGVAAFAGVAVAFLNGLLC